MKKQTGHCISVVCAMGVVALSSVMVMADETIPSETIPIIEEIENEGGSSGGLLLFALFFCIAIGAVIGYFVAMRHAKKLYVEDYVYNNEEEVTALAAKFADKVKAKKIRAEKAKAAAEEKEDKRQKIKETAEKKKHEAQLQKEARIEKNREITLRKKERPGKAASIKPEKEEPARSPAPLPDLSGLIEGDGVDYAGRKFYYDPKDPTGGVDPFYFEGAERKYYD